MGQQLERLLQSCTVKLSIPGNKGWGTGFFVAPGLILTCHHVVKDAKNGKVHVCWQNQKNFEAVIERSFPELDLALLRFSPSVVDSPCVYLDESFQADDSLYIYGYPDDFPQGASVTGKCEGIATDKQPLIKFKAGQIRPGLSGSPLLNQRTGKVCGLVKFTRDRSIDLGGGAVPTTAIFSKLPELVEKNRTFHEQNNDWVVLLPSPEGETDSGSMPMPDDSELEKLADLLKRSGRAGHLARRALCIEIRVDPDELDFLAQTAPRDFARQLVFYLSQTGDTEALLRLCRAIAPILKGAFAADLAAIQAKLR